MDDVIKLAIIECATCSALIEVFRRYEPVATIIVWSAQDDNSCEQQSVGRCPQARAEVKSRYIRMDDI